VNTSLASNPLQIKVPYLKDRAQMLKKARAFFEDKGVIEVDCPALSHAAPIDLHIDVMKVALKNDQLGYLHTSPEYGMKRLLSAEIGDIYQISHVFRDGEIGPLHNPEFTMAEWYRIGFSFDQMIAETLDFIRLFLGNLTAQSMTYRQTLQHHLGIDYLTATPSNLLDCAKDNNLDLPSDAASWDKDTLLQLLVSFLIEPKLGTGHLFVLSHFPASQAALSKTFARSDGEPVACRFEVYYQGIELANGYHELTDASEQKRRFEASNRARVEAGKDALKVDERFLEALQFGLPDCCGVAVGFDRLMQLKHGLKELKNVLPLIWEES
jgi:elongation factor P--(R)-beta-lysine ligase